MKDHVYKILELVGSSEKGIDDPVQNAISRASKTIREMKWFEVVHTRGHIEKGVCSPLPGHVAGRIYTRGVILSLSPAGDEIIERLSRWSKPRAGASAFGRLERVSRTGSEWSRGRCLLRSASEPRQTLGCHNDLRGQLDTPESVDRRDVHLLGNGPPIVVRIANARRQDHSIAINLLIWELRQ